MTSPGLRAMLQGRASGITFMALFGAAWACLAAERLPTPYAQVLYAIAAAVAVVLLRVSAGFRREAHQQPELTPAEQAAVARKDRWFYWVLAGEMLALFITGNLLVNLHLLTYLLPAVALIVGLHFYPLAWAFRLPIYWLTATLMSLAGLLAIVALATGHAPGAPGGWDSVTGIVCAVVLWGTAGFIILKVRRLMKAA